MTGTTRARPALIGPRAGRGRDGIEDSFEAERPALFGHCYRMLGSSAEAEDAVQDTLLRALKGRAAFEGRSARATWLYRIATNVCIDRLRQRGRRELPTASLPEGTIDDELVERPAGRWLEPVPDAAVLPPDADPEQLLALRQSLRLAFVASIQQLPPRQRATLLLKDVLGFSTKEIAETLATSTASVNSALQRARATLAAVEPAVLREQAALTANQRDLVERYVDAFHAYDVDALVSLLREDATLSMPPYTLWLRGPRTIAAWFLGRGVQCRGSRLVRTAASGSVAFGQYRRSETGYRAWSLVVLELDADRIASMTHFLDVESVFPRFELPLALPADDGADDGADSA